MQFIISIMLAYILVGCATADYEGKNNDFQPYEGKNDLYQDAM